MSFEPKKWEDEPNPLGVLQGTTAPTSKTPVDAESLIDLEQRLAAYTDSKAAVPFGEAAPSLGLASGALDVQLIPAVVKRLFEGASLESEWNLSGVGEVVPTISAEHAKSGKACKFVLTGTQQRSEITFAWLEGVARRVRQGDRVRMSFYVYIPEGRMAYGGAGHHNTFWQVHVQGAEPEGFGTCFSLELAEYEAGKKGVYLESREPGTKTEKHYWVGAAAEGAFHKITIDFILSGEVSGGWYQIAIDGVVCLEKSGVATCPGGTEAYVKCGLYSGKEGTRELFISQVEWEELSRGTTALWAGQAPKPPFKVAEIRPPGSILDNYEDFKAYSIAILSGETKEVSVALKDPYGSAVKPTWFAISPLNPENGLEPKWYLRQVGETEFEIKNNSAKTFTFLVKASFQRKGG